MRKLKIKNESILSDGYHLKLWWIPFLCIWVIIILICIRYKNELSIEKILAFTPKSPVLAALVILLLFALKSLSIVFYCGILYAVDGILFSLPVAIFLNLCGTAVMVSIPYFIGKKAGSPLVRKLTEKYPKIEKMREIRSDNNLFFTFFVRFIGFLPCDIVSLYMGAIGIPYPTYFIGCLLGMLPPTITLPIMGINITDVSSPGFLIALGVEIMLMASSFFIYRIYKKKRTGERAE